MRCTTPKPSETNASARLASWSANAPRSVVVLAGLARVEADVLQHRDLAVLEPATRSVRALPHRVGGEGDRPGRAARRAARPPAAGSTPGPARPWAGRGGAPTTTRAPASASAWIVGTLARIRPSSVIGRAVERHVEVGADQDPLAPERSARGESMRCRHRSEARADVRDQVGEAVGVAPLVVVPADDLDLVADHLGQRRVEDARRRVGDDVGGDDRVGGVAEVAAVGGGLLDRGVDLLDGGLATGPGGGVTLGGGGGGGGGGGVVVVVDDDDDDDDDDDWWLVVGGFLVWFFLVVLVVSVWWLVGGWWFGLVVFLMVLVCWWWLVLWLLVDW